MNHEHMSITQRVYSDLCEYGRDWAITGTRYCSCGAVSECISRNIKGLQAPESGTWSNWNYPVTYNMD